MLIKVTFHGKHSDPKLMSVSVSPPFFYLAPSSFCVAFEDSRCYMDPDISAPALSPVLAALGALLCH